MSGIRQPLTDILTKLATIQAINLDHQTVNLYSRVWNNQIGSESYEYPKPAAFVEFVTPVTYEKMGQGYLNADLGVKIHLVHVFYNNEGTFEQDLEIFDLRDKVIAAMSFYCPSGCGPLNVVSESQDFDHTNIYHYVIDFICNFVDGTASNEERTGQYEEITPDLDVNTVRGGVPVIVPETDYMIINQNNTHK